MEDFADWRSYWSSRQMVETERGKFNVYTNGPDTQFVIVCAHGAGHSALSFSLFAQKMQGLRVIAPDFKCHGETSGDEAKDMTLDGITDDFVAIVQKLVPADKKVVLVGHSLGGSVVTFACQKIKGPHVMAIVVIDTIEGQSIEQIPQMHRLIETRPRKFMTASDAISYVATSGEMSNYESARISVSGRVRNVGDGYVWITDLLKCESAWAGWFSNFANTFMSVRPYKILVLPTIDRLDTPFTIGHMSGKFQLSVINETNHCVHEDAPEKLCEVIVKMIKRIGGSAQW